MSDKTVAIDMADESTRWAAWITRGAEQDRKTQKYTVAIFATVAVVLATSLAIALAAR
jgi:type IV secretory pathway component VirB8